MQHCWQYDESARLAAERTKGISAYGVERQKLRTINGAFGGYTHLSIR